MRCQYAHLDPHVLENTGVNTPGKSPADPGNISQGGVPVKISNPHLEVFVMVTI